MIVKGWDRNWNRDGSVMRQKMAEVGMRIGLGGVRGNWE